jgi:CRISPR/Cas system-associated exonuclease Cas4 (RecB family)
MPAREDMDAIYAYYFYRLLQRAEKVDLLFNGGSDGLRTGEMSRYLHQLKFAEGLKVKRPGLEVRAREVPVLKVQHTADATEKLKKFIYDGEEGKYLSPSAVNTYIDCSLKYYLRYLAGIGEPDEILEDIDASGFGTVVHESLKELYSGIAARNNRQITKEELLALINSALPEEVLRSEFVKQHFKGRKREKLEGRNIITFRVMLRYLEKIIRTDLTIAPFELLSAENNFGRKLKIDVDHKAVEIRMGGKIDRIDRVDGRIRVIDYKTGQSNQRFSSIDSLFERNYGSRNGAAMQTLFYAWLVGEEYAGDEVMPGLYAMKALFEDRFDPALHMTSMKKEGRIGSFSPLEEQFLQHLQGIVQELFDPAVPFEQRQNDKKCSYCDFASLCQRSPLD